MKIKEKNEDILGEFNFFNSNKFSNKKKISPKKFIANLFGTFILAQFVLACSYIHNFSHSVNNSYINTMDIFNGWPAMQKSLREHDEKAILINYAENIKSSSGMGNLLMSNVTEMIQKDDNISQDTKNEVVKMWHENEFTGINHEYLNMRSVTDCMIVDLSCMAINHVVQFDYGDQLIRAKITLNSYNIDHPEQFKKASENPSKYITTDYYHTATTYAENHALESRPVAESISQIMKKTNDN